MRNFFDDVKNVLVENHVSMGYGYYSILEQCDKQISDLINDYESQSMCIYYSPDDTEGYTNGFLSFIFDSLDGIRFTYSIHLLRDDLYWGYCQCTPEDEGYNPVKGCCGKSCDWIAPKIRIVKTADIAQVSFNGLKKDLWKLEDEWKEASKESLENKIDEQLEWFDEQIADWQKRKEMYIQEKMKL